MSRFESFLSRTSARLSLPAATRCTILTEITADLEDLFQHYLDQGLSEQEAAARAEETVGMSDESLAEMVRIHSRPGGWFERIIRRPQPFWERIAMALIVVFIVAVTALETEWKPFAHTTIVLWPALAILVALVGWFVAQLYRMSSNPSLRRMRDSLTTPLFLGAASVVVGLAGTGIEMYRALMIMAADPRHSSSVLERAILANTSTFGVALLVALCAAIAWFVLAGRVARIEDAAARTFEEVK